MVADMNPRSAAHRLPVVLGFVVVIVVFSCVSVLPTTCCSRRISSFTASDSPMVAAPTALSLAKLPLNRSTSFFTTFSFLFSAPFRLRKLFSRTFPSFNCFKPSSVSPLARRSGNAFLRESRSVTSFLEGRRRLRAVLLDFSIRETKDECFTSRLSFLEFMNESVTWAESGRSAFRGAYGSGSLDLAASLARRERRLEGAVGAYVGCDISP